MFYLEFSLQSHFINPTELSDPLTYTVVALNIFFCTFYLKMVTDRGRNML
jgi:hypothetical protein